MPRLPQHSLLWSEEQGLYERFIQGQVVARFSSGDEAAWLAWLDTVSSLAFHGRTGSLNVYLETRPRGGQYWYAYHTSGGRTRKRYLGRTAQVSLARLEATAQALASDQTLPRSSALFSVAPPPSGDDLELLVTKLAPPRLPHTLVPRERLFPLLNEALKTPLTLLSASAGWGKTTLLASWASRHPHKIAWLSLDALDNELTRFWTAVIAALRTCVPDVGTGALAMLRSPQPPPMAAVVTVLLNELAERKEHAALLLLLDDYQVLDEPTIQEALAFWVEHQPPQLHLLLSSRVDPDLPLARWRAQGRLLELRTAELRFTQEDASTFLQDTMGLALAQDEVAALQQRTEGWVAGLQLAALSLRQQEDRSAWIAALTGSQRYLLDYVQQEILPRQPLPLQRFLEQVAILRSMNAALAEAVTGEPASQELLEALERGNLFVAPLDDQRQWYRLHDLFREALLAHVQASQPEMLPVLHLRAAHCYEAAGELREAISHALQARDFFYAVRLMEQAAPRLWVSGEAQTVLGWMDVLPDAVLWQHAPLALTALLRLLESSHTATEASYIRLQAQVERTVSRLDRLPHRQADDTYPAEGMPAPQADLLVIERRLHLLHALIETRAILQRADQDRLTQVAQELERCSSGEEEMSWRLIALAIDFWLIESFQGQGALLLPRLLEAKQQAERGGDLLARIRVQEWLAFAYLRAGQWRQVEREGRAALALIAQHGGRTAWAGYLYGFLTDVYYVWNRLDEAARANRKTLRIARDWQQVDLLLMGYHDAAQIALARDDLPAADQALHQAEVLVQQEQPALSASAVAAFRVQFWLAAGDLEAARRWAEQVVFSPATWDPNDRWALLALVQVQLALGQYPQALDLLERFRLQLDRPGDMPIAQEWLALHVVALHQTGQHKLAQDALVRLLERTGPEGGLRVYLDRGEPMRQVLQAFLAAHARAHEPASSTMVQVTRVLAAFRQEAQGASRSLPPTTRAMPEPSLASISPPPVASLTQREQEVLRLLAAGASNQDIARTLVIQLSTVKKHVSSLLGKLGAASRTQAVAQARVHSLL